MLDIFKNNESGTIPDIGKFRYRGMMNIWRDSVEKATIPNRPSWFPNDSSELKPVKRDPLTPQEKKRVFQATVLLCQAKHVFNNISIGLRDDEGNVLDRDSIYDKGETICNNLRDTNSSR